ncbi:MAG TPA: exonuclease SbcCD subunit D, partial [Anaerolineae bacterium]|nr:exonuclease SbcCD subunit D [Anaerolineae bacterium]
MIKVLHFADAHLGVENYGRPDASTGLHTRLLDFLRSFDEMIDRAEEEEVDLAIFAGDAYKTRNPSPTQQREFAKRIMRLADICPVVMVAGNHDVFSAKGRATTLDIFGLIPLYQTERGSVSVSTRPGIHIFETNREFVQIIAIPWIVRSHMLAAVKTQGGNVNEMIQNSLRVLIEGLLGQADPNVPTILAAHGTVAGAVYGSEHSASLGAEIILPPELFYDRRIDYVALGHIHKHQILW